MNTFIKLSVGVLVLSMAQMSFATDASWTESKRAPKVLSEKGNNSSFFAAPSATPRKGGIDTVEWEVGWYRNGATVQRYEICYAPWPTTNYTKCLDISGNRFGRSSYFSGGDAKGRFRITGYLVGGTYPVNPIHSNVIKVNYSY